MQAIELGVPLEFHECFHVVWCLANYSSFHTLDSKTSMKEHGISLIIRTFGV